MMKKGSMNKMMWVFDEMLMGVFEEGDVPVKVMKVVPVKVGYNSSFWSSVRGGEVDNCFRYGLVRKKYLELAGIRLSQLDELDREDDVLVIGTPVGDEKGMWVLVCGGVEN